LGILVAAEGGFFCKFGFMKALVITPKNDDEFNFLSNLLKKLGVASSALGYEDLEDIGLSKLMREADKTKKASRAEIMKKLSA
jgi:hypothetical protein